MTDQPTQKLEQYHLTDADEFEEIVLSTEVKLRLIIASIMDARQALDAALRKLEQLIGEQE